MLNKKDNDQDLVSEFMVKGNQWDGTSSLSITPSEDELKTYKLRLKLILEETFEMLEAVTTDATYQSIFDPILNNINQGIDNLTLETLEVKPVDLFDALVDIRYVLAGFANIMNLDLKAGFEEVQRSNLSKFGPEGIPTFREDGKIMKDPRTYSEPDLRSVYENTTYTYTKS